ncbi:MAG: glycerol-3-phosphate 1-O-acyltransferase PlsY [Bacteroidales bacterium]|nr:glycerol-3-phosphate 1-O-acyltransferase PlsY [Bacteroidales bacterium]
MDIIIDIILPCIAIILAYLIGSIPNAVWIGEVFYGKDVRKEGSKNAGATNTIRVLGLKPGLVVLVLDLLKGIVPLAILPEFVDKHHHYLPLIQIFVAVATVVGHVFPVFAGFRGGKGVATLVGILIMLYSQVFFIVAGIFFGMLFLFRYVSLASISAAISLPILYIASLYFYVRRTLRPLIGFVDEDDKVFDFYWAVGYHFPNLLIHYLPLLIFAILIAIFVPLTHIKNIKRLIRKEEPRFVFRKHSQNEKPQS